MKLAVIGSRTFKNKNRLYLELDNLRRVSRITEIISGGCKTGADLFAKEYAEDRDLKYTEFAADWTDMSEPCVIRKNAYGEYNALAGNKRNIKIAEYSDKAMSFYDSGECKGTNDCVKEFRKRQKPVKEIHVP